MNFQISDKIVEALVTSALGRSISNKSESWNYGWAFESYRRSPDAAIAIGDKILALSPEAVRTFEFAMHKLLKMQVISKDWDHDELWGVVALIVANCAMTEDKETLRNEICLYLERIVFHGGTFVIFPISNIKYEPAPFLMADMVIGIVSKEWREVVSAVLRERLSMDFSFIKPNRKKAKAWWLTNADTPRLEVDKKPEHERVLAAAIWVTSRGRKAVHDAKKRFHEFIDLILFLEQDLDALGLFSLRGDANMPGIRGLTLHRNALGAIGDSEDSKILNELHCQTVIVDKSDCRLSVNWFGEDLFPLEKFVEPIEKRRIIEQLIMSSNPIHGRIRTAARWHSKSHWALDEEEAVLFIGIAFDALLGDDAGPQRRELSERFALLEPIMDNREDAYQLFANVYYTARSQVAHGQPCSFLDSEHFSRRMSTDLRRSALVIYALTEAMHIENERDYSRFFKSARWGTSCVPSVAQFECYFGKLRGVYSARARSQHAGERGASRARVLKTAG